MLRHTEAAVQSLWENTRLTKIIKCKGLRRQCKLFSGKMSNTELSNTKFSLGCRLCFFFFKWQNVSDLPWDTVTPNVLTGNNRNGLCKAFTILYALRSWHKHMSAGPLSQSSLYRLHLHVELEDSSSFVTLRCSLKFHNQLWVPDTTPCQDSSAKISVHQQGEWLLQICLRDFKLMTHVMHPVNSELSMQLHYHIIGAA